MKISVVAAMAVNRVIGSNGSLPWHIPSELAHFRRITLGKPMIMGRTTFESIGRPLPGRVSIVISGRGRVFPGCLAARSIEEAIAIAKRSAERTGANEIAIVGGASVYSGALPIADTIRLTVIQQRFEGDAKFPEISDRDFSLVSTEPLPADRVADPAMRIELYKRISLSEG